MHINIVYVIMHHKAYVGQTINMVDCGLINTWLWSKASNMELKHHFNGYDSSINNLVWALVNKVDDEFTKRDTEA